MKKTLGVVTAFSAAFAVNCTNEAGLDSLQGPVVGGTKVTDANSFQYKHTVGIATPGGTCTGVPISSRHVLTAGHCLGGSPSAAQVHVFFDFSLPPGTLPSNVASYVRHPDYADLPAVTAFDWFHKNDIAIIELVADLPASKEPLDLFPVPNAQVITGNPSTVVGYGLTENPFEYFLLGRGEANVLYQATLTPTEYLPETVAGPKFILRSEPGTPAPCFGDSGGPLIQEQAFAGRPSQRYLVALNSEAFDPQVAPGDNLLTFECQGPGSYAAYTPVGAYGRWIEETTGLDLGFVDELDWLNGRNQLGMADADGNGYTDGTDFLIWQRTYGNVVDGSLPAGIPIEGDYNRDNAVDAADYVLWRKFFGTVQAATDMSGDIDTDGALTYIDLALILGL
jgi:secreted trypsin-like serine protease